MEEAGENGLFGKGGPAATITASRSSLKLLLVMAAAAQLGPLGVDSHVFKLQHMLCTQVEAAGSKGNRCGWDLEGQGGGSQGV